MPWAVCRLGLEGLSSSRPGEAGWGGRRRCRYLPPQATPRLRSVRGGCRGYPPSRLRVPRRGRGRPKAPF